MLSVEVSHVGVQKKSKQTKLSALGVAVTRYQESLAFRTRKTSFLRSLGLAKSLFRSQNTEVRHWETGR
jgi:hypothetical protein